MQTRQGRYLVTAGGKDRRRFDSLDRAKRYGFNLPFQDGPKRIRDCQPEGYPGASVCVEWKLGRRGIWHPLTYHKMPGREDVA